MSDIADRIKKQRQSSTLFQSSEAPIEDTPDSIDQMSMTPPSGIAPRGDGNIMVPNVQHIRKGLRSDQRTRGGEKGPVVERQRYESPTLPELPEPKPDELFAPGGPHGPDAKGIIPGRGTINPWTKAKGKAAVMPTIAGGLMAGKMLGGAAAGTGLMAVAPYAAFALMGYHIINSHVNKPKPRSVGPGGFLRAAEGEKDYRGQDHNIVTDPDTGIRYLEDPGAKYNYGQSIMVPLDDASLEKYREQYLQSTSAQGLRRNVQGMDELHAYQQYMDRGGLGLSNREVQDRERMGIRDPGAPDPDWNVSGQTADAIKARGMQTGRGWTSIYGYGPAPDHGKA